MKTLLNKLLKIAYLLLFVWCFITGILNANAPGGTALMAIAAIAAIQCVLAIAYDALNNKINRNNNN